MKLDLNTLGFEPIEMDNDELVDGAILLVRSQCSGDKVRMVSRATDADLFVVAGMLKAATRWNEHAIDQMDVFEEGDDTGL